MRAAVSIVTTGNTMLAEESYSSYRRPNPVGAQVGLLNRIFYGNLSYRMHHTAPDHFEGLFAILRWDRVASTYGVACQRMLAVLSDNFRRTGFTAESRLWEAAEKWKLTSEAGLSWETLLLNYYEDDITLLDAHFGAARQGMSASEARRWSSDAEFVLGPFEVMCMLLTHRQRFSSPQDLKVVCAGWVFPGRSDNSREALSIEFSGTGILLDYVGADELGRFGIPTAMLPG